MLLRRFANLLARFSLFIAIVACLGLAVLINRQGRIEFTLFSQKIIIDEISYVSAALAGVAVGFPLGQALGGMLRRRRWRRWSAMTLLVVYVLVVSLLWGRHATAVAIPSIILTFIFTAIMLREVYLGSIKETVLHHLRMTFGMLRGFQIVNNGKMIVPAEGGVVLGPRLLIIRPGNAVVTIVGNKHKVYGPGVLETAGFEYIDKIYDLSEQQRSFRIQNILTAERIPVNARVLVTYSIDIEGRRAHGDDAFQDADKDKIKKLMREVAEWKTMTVDTVEQIVRDVITIRKFDALVRPDIHRRLGEEVREIANLHFQKKGWAIRLDNVVIKDLQPAQEMGVAASRHWSEEKRAEAWRNVLDTMARGYEGARNLGMTDEELKREVLRYTLEQIAKDPTTSIMFNRELNELMAMLR